MVLLTDIKEGLFEATLAENGIKPIYALRDHSFFFSDNISYIIGDTVLCKNERNTRTFMANNRLYEFVSFIFQHQYFIIY